MKSGAVGGMAMRTFAAPAAMPRSSAQLTESAVLADARPLTPKEREHQRLASKLDPAIVAVIERMKNGSAPLTAQEARFIKNGKAEIRIWLTDTSPQSIALLKQLGFEIVLEPKTAKMLIGRLPVAKLAALAELAFVRYVSPQL
jgi:hypothetical protein